MHVHDKSIGVVQTHGKSHSRAVLNCTKLCDNKLQKAMSPPGNFVDLGKRLHAEARIWLLEVKNGQFNSSSVRQLFPEDTSSLGVVRSPAPLARLGTAQQPGRNLKSFDGGHHRR